MQEYLDNEPDKPYIMCEYSHCMGNGPGDLEDYFQFIQSHDGLVGGFLWNGATTVFIKGKCPTAATSIITAATTMSGRMTAISAWTVWSTPTAARTGLLEFKNVYRPARVVKYDRESGMLTLHNYMDFVDLTEYAALGFPVSCDGKDLPCRTESHDMGFDENSAGEHGQPQPESLSYVERHSRRQQNHRSGECARYLTLQDKHFTYAFNKLTGLFATMQYDGESLLDEEMVFNIWRAPTDNDRKLKLDWLGCPL